REAGPGPRRYLTHGGRTAWVTRPSSARVLQRVPNRLQPDLPVPEDERVDPVLGLGPRRGAGRLPVAARHRPPPSRRDLSRHTLVTWVSSTSWWNAPATSPPSR